MLKWVLRGRGRPQCVRVCFHLYLLDCACIYACAYDRMCELECIRGSLIFPLVHPDRFTGVLMQTDTLCVEGGT